MTVGVLPVWNVRRWLVASEFWFLVVDGSSSFVVPVAMVGVRWARFIDWLRLRSAVAAITGYSRDVLLHLRSVANGRHVVAKQTAELIKAYGLRRPRRRRGCRAGRRAKPRLPAATSADQSANCLAAAASRQSTTATTTTTTTTDDSAQSSVNNQRTIPTDWQSAVSQLIRVITSYTNYYFWSSLP